MMFQLPVASDEWVWSIYMELFHLSGGNQIVDQLKDIFVPKK